MENDHSHNLLRNHWRYCHNFRNRVTGWLTSQGFSIDEVGKGRNWINFSGQARHVESAFRTKMHDYKVSGKIHHANAQNPTIPRALADRVAGVVSLHSFPLKPNLIFADGNNYLAPGDFAAIYNVNPLYNASPSINGSGVGIAIVGRTNPSPDNWAIFRNRMGLPYNPPIVVVPPNSSDPGDLGPGDDNHEADLDVEWAGAVAKNATIYFVPSAPTNATEGVHLSAQYIVDDPVFSQKIHVMNTSFGQCESIMTTAENSFYSALWAQAAAEGITSFVASGDSEVAGCIIPDHDSGNITSWAPGVNGIASTPYNVAVGGTMFNEGTGDYWNSTYGADLTTVKRYIPEVAWIESGYAQNCPAGDNCLDYRASGGGPSSKYPKPMWQVGSGSLNDGWRDIPDVSLTAGKHDGYCIITSYKDPQTGIINSGGYAFPGGTSAASPAFAGIMALIVQNSGHQRQGNVNPKLYQLSYAQRGLGGPSVFHDITSGDTSVPNVPGYNAVAGYNLATGLGSVDATALVHNWPGPGGSYPAIISGGGNYSIPLYLPTGVAYPSGLTTSSTYCFSVGEYACDGYRPTPLFGYVSPTSFSGSIPLYLPPGTIPTATNTYCASWGEYDCDLTRPTPLFGYVSPTSFSGSIPLYLVPGTTSPVTNSSYCVWDDGMGDCMSYGTAPVFGYIATSTGAKGGQYTCPFGGTLSGATCNR